LDIQIPEADHGITEGLVQSIAPSIGEIALSWGFIESHLRAVYWTLERTHGVPMPTEKAGFDVVVDIIRQACVKLPEFDQSKGSLGGLLRAAASEAKTLGVVRNTVCHWTLTSAKEGMKGKQTKLQFVQWRGNNGLNVFQEKWYGVEELRNLATRSIQLGSLLAELASEAVERLEPDHPERGGGP
jgi:hypothetical protein